MVDGLPGLGVIDLIILVLAGTSFMRLWFADDIVAPYVTAVTERLDAHSNPVSAKLAYLTRCEFCMSFWAMVAIISAWLYGPEWLQVVVVAFALRYPVALWVEARDQESRPW